MKILRPTATLRNPRSKSRRLARACALTGFLISTVVVAAIAQAGSAPSAAQAPASAAASGTNAPPSPHLKGVLNLDGPWRFQEGDDLRWADPAFDDSSWMAVNLSQPLSDQGVDPYSGYGWYRLRLEPQQLEQAAAISANATPALLVESDQVGQLAVYVNGVEAGHSRGMTDEPSEYESPPLAISLTNGNPGAPLVLAIRSWAGPNTAIKRGLLAQVNLGSQD